MVMSFQLEYHLESLVAMVEMIFMCKKVSNNVFFFSFIFLHYFSLDDNHDKHKMLKNDPLQLVDRKLFVLLGFHVKKKSEQ